jgi:hypothetical protein
MSASDENDSPLELGMHGTYQGHGFEIRGVVRLAHETGGYWDEWYLLFDDGRWGWLAEVQQHFYLTFAVDLKAGSKIPPFHEIQLEQRFLLRAGDPPMLVIEKGFGRLSGTRGEIPYALTPQKEYQYADLSGPGGRFATIDYGDVPPTVYFGRSVPLGDLHLPHRAEDTSHVPRDVEEVHRGCPNCHRDLRLYAPHKTVRVGCTNCGSLLDADEGQLTIKQSLTGAPKPHLPIGSKGPLFGTHYTVVGFLRRCLKSDRTATWDEYLLYDPQTGYRWLTLSDGHWNFVQSVPPGSVELQGKHACYQGKTYSWSEQEPALVVCVLGEFYWKVDPGEQVWMTDYLCGTEMLSREITHGGPDSGEISWSRAVYLSVQTVEQAFGLKHAALPRPVTRASNQPSGLGRLYAWWGVMVALTIALGIFFQARGLSQRVFQATYRLPTAIPGAAGAPQPFQAGGPPAFNPGLPGAGGDFGGPVSGGTAANATTSGGTSGGNTANSDEGEIFFSTPFDVRNNENLEIRVRALGTNFWLGIDGDLVDEQTGVIQEFSLPLEYYQGVDEGEAWSEGSTTGSVFLSALPAGKYTMRLVGHHEPPSQLLNFEVGIYENVPRTAHFLWALAGVSVIPGIALLLQSISAFSRRNQ